MTEVRLPPEVISLVHHVELNKAGWWEKSLQRLILAAIWLADRPFTEETLVEAIRSSFHVVVDRNKLREQVNTLREEHTVVSLPEGTLRLTKAALSSFEEELREAEEITSHVQEKFSRALEAHCPSLKFQETWEQFDQGLLIPLVREMGANTTAVNI